MRNRPRVRHPDLPLPPGGTGQPQPQQVGDVMSPFLVSGGAVAFRVDEGFDPRPDGVQLVAFVYIPRGVTGFVKQIRCAPFCPAALVDPFRSSGVENANTTWSAYSPAAQNGVWETPFAWEAYVDPELDPQPPPPQWRWHLRFVRGDVGLQRSKLPAFSPADPSTWFLTPNVAVPRSAYRGGIPGNAPSGFWQPQRVQAIQGDELTCHVMVPPDNSLCLFAEWTQAELAPRAVISGSEGTTSYFDPIFPLLPSWGSLLGYTQPADREVTTENARHGWGG